MEQRTKIPQGWGGVGIRKPRFRMKLQSWRIRHEVLYGILLVRGIALSVLAEEIGVHPRTVNRWIYEGSKPNQENIDKLCRLLGYPAEILFYEKLD
ncbi:MAG TPA: helix-turn-helix transcriptional regulator [Bacillota bacterium]